MATGLFGRLGPSSHGTRSFYEDLQAGDDDGDLEEGTVTKRDQENHQQQLRKLDAEGLAPSDSRVTIESASVYNANRLGKATRERHGHLGNATWQTHDDEQENDVPASLLVEPNYAEGSQPVGSKRSRSPRAAQRIRYGANQRGQTLTQWDAETAQQRFHSGDSVRETTLRPRSVVATALSSGRREKALWRWANTSNLDSFMRDVYDYFEGCGLTCILCSNALWLL